MSIEAMKLAAEFNRYFTSGNGVDVPAKVSVSRDEWRALFTAIQQAEAQQPVTPSLQAVCRYISDVLAGDASSSEKHIARTIMHLLPLEQSLSGQHPAIPEGWVPCIVTYEGQHPEEVAYGPQRMMERLKKWLDRYFEMKVVQQPATGEPVACATPDGLKSNWHAHHVIVDKAALQMVRNALRNDVERGLKVRGEMLAELDAATFQAHPAPSVPDDVVLKAMRYEWLRYSDLDDAAAKFWPEGGVPEGDAFDAAINAAMLAAAQAQKGGA